jgi:hypothetical protein
MKQAVLGISSTNTVVYAYIQKESLASISSRLWLFRSLNGYLCISSGRSVGYSLKPFPKKGCLAPLFRVHMHAPEKREHTTCKECKSFAQEKKITLQGSTFQLHFQPEPARTT